MQPRKRLFSNVRKVPWLLAAVLAAAEIGVIALIFELRIIAFLFDQLIFQNRTIELFTTLIFWIAVLVLLRAGLQFCVEYLAKILAIQIKSDFRRQIQAKMLHVGASEVKQRERVRTLLMDGVEALDAYFSQYIPQILIAVFIPITILAFVFRIDRLSGLVLVLTAPLLPMFMVLIGRFSKHATERQWSVLNRMSAFFLDSIQGIRMLKVFNQESRHKQRIERVSKDYHQATMSVLRITFLSAFALEFVATLATAIVAVQIGLRVLYGRLVFEQAFFILLVAPEFYLPLRNLGLRFHAAMNGIQAARDIFAFLDLPENKEKVPKPAKRINISAHRVIRVNNLSVRYPSADQDALSEVNFEIPIGKETAIIGPSGAGKSTINQVLLRYLEPRTGGIYLDELAIDQISTADWRQQISWLPQNPWFFNGTILDNIRIAKKDATFAEIERAAAQAQLDDFIRSLPHGYETDLSETGNLLSTGQRQRIAAARIFLRRSPLILLDEPSANLDSVTEKELLDAMRALKGSSTLINIAHRLDTILLADHVVIVNNGKIMAAGSHDELISTSAFYQSYISAYFGGLQ